MAPQVVTDASSPVAVSFNPALWLQRQSFMLETLREMGPKSVLDIGCGEGSLLECLARCDDALPIELLAGIDISLDTVESASDSILTTAELQQLDGRWRPLEVTLLHGTFPPFQVLIARNFYTTPIRCWRI
jgi:2-polyprenyl-3-methyl-5-hydroxy-6-metoxy-1,4-benzoquinol methylase